MVRSGVLLTLFASAASFFSQADAAKTKSSSKILPGNYIVEFEDATVSLLYIVPVTCITYPLTGANCVGFV